jgi:hypothetical protein
LLRVKITTAFSVDNLDTLSAIAAVFLVSLQ